MTTTSSQPPRDPAPASSPGTRAELESTLKKASTGDERAWAMLVEAYSGRVFGLIRAQCNSSDLAEEITQSTFCTLVAKIGEYTELGRFEQWLFRIAMNRLRDEMRRRKRQARPVEDEALHAFADHSEAARTQRDRAGETVDEEQLRALRSAMKELSDTDQQIIHLRHNAGLSFKEIADVLEQPLGTVLARQHRALKKLAELLKESMGREPSIGKVRRPSANPDSPKSAQDGQTDRTLIASDAEPGEGSASVETRPKSRG